MSDEMYTIISKKMMGIDIEGFTVKDLDESEKYISYEDCIKLVRLNKISNASLLLDVITGEYILNIDGGLNSIKTVHNEPKYKASGRLIKNNKCIGYILTDNTGKSLKISINKVWNLANNNEIEGIQGIILNTHKVLVSTEKDFIQSLNRLNT